MPKEMTNQEAIEMMRRCKEEISSLRARIAYLEPKADAYDALSTVLGLLPKKSVGMGEDLVCLLERRIKELPHDIPSTK